MIKIIPYESPIGIFYKVYINNKLEMIGASKDEAKEIYECFIYKNNKRKIK